MYRKPTRYSCYTRVPLDSNCIHILYDLLEEAGVMINKLMAFRVSSDEHIQKKIEECGGPINDLIKEVTCLLTKPDTPCNFEIIVHRHQLRLECFKTMLKQIEKVRADHGV